jgi:hypothetical protein
MIKKAEKMSTIRISNKLIKSSKSEAPYALAQQLTAIYTTMPASESKEETKVIPPDCFF